MRSFLILAASAAVLSACASDGTANRNAPDEFAILTKAPLTVPPDYALLPPKPGETRPQELSTTQRTEQLLLGDTNAAPPSNGELALIQEAGALEVDPSIRVILAAENGGQADKEESLSNRLLFWNYDADGNIDDSAAPLVVDNRDAWMNQRRESIERVTGPGARVIIAVDEKEALALPGVR